MKKIVRLSLLAITLMAMTLGSSCDILNDIRDGIKTRREAKHNKKKLGEKNLTKLKLSSPINEYNVSKIELKGLQIYPSMDIVSSISVPVKNHKILDGRFIGRNYDSTVTNTLSQYKPSVFYEMIGDTIKAYVDSFDYKPYFPFILNHEDSTYYFALGYKPDEDDMISFPYNNTTFKAKSSYQSAYLLFEGTIDNQPRTFSRNLTGMLVKGAKIEIKKEVKKGDKKGKKK